MAKTYTINEQYKRATKKGKKHLYHKGKRYTLAAAKKHKDYKEPKKKATAKEAVKKLSKKKSATPAKKRGGKHDVTTTNDRVNYLMEKLGLDMRTAYEVVEAEQATGAKVKVNSGYRDLEKEQRIWDQKFEEFVGTGTFPQAVETAIRLGNTQSRTADPVGTAIQRVKDAGGGSAAVASLIRFRKGKAAVGHSKHSKTRSTMDFKKTSDSKKIKNWLEKHKGYREHPEVDKHGKTRTDIYHIEKREDYKTPETDLGDIRRMDKDIKSLPDGGLSSTATMDQILGMPMQSKEYVSLNRPEIIEEQAPVVPQEYMMASADPMFKQKALQKIMSDRTPASLPVREPAIVPSGPIERMPERAPDIDMPGMDGGSLDIPTGREYLRGPNIVDTEPQFEDGGIADSKIVELLRKKKFSR